METVADIAVLDGRRREDLPRRRKPSGVTGKEGGPRAAGAQGAKSQQEKKSGKRKWELREEHNSGNGSHGEGTPLEVESSASAEVPSKRKKLTMEHGEGEKQVSATKSCKTVRKSKTAAGEHDVHRDGSDLTPESEDLQLHRPRKERMDTETTQFGDPESAPRSAVSPVMHSAHPKEFDKEGRLSKERRKTHESLAKRRKGGKQGQSGVLAVEDLRKAKRRRERPPSKDLLQSLGLGGEVGSGNTSSWM